MDMWKPFRNSTQKYAPQAAILFDKFHVMRHLNEALDTVRKSEYARLSGKDRRFIKGQKYTLLSGHENLTLAGRRSLKLLLAAEKPTAASSGGSTTRCASSSAARTASVTRNTCASRSSPACCRPSDPHSSYG